jgi:large subunit ribosomal protein L30
MSKKLKITQIRSTIKRLENQKRTIFALGIKRLHHTVIHDDTPIIRGMVGKVAHLVRVEPFEE